MNQLRKIALFVGLDLLIIWSSVFSSFALRFAIHIPEPYVKQMIIFGMVLSCACIVHLFFFRIYHQYWGYASVNELLLISYAVVSANVFAYLITYWILGFHVPYGIIVQTFESMLILFGLFRFVWRVYYDSRRRNKEKQKTLIIGAGNCGRIIVRELKQSQHSRLQPVALIDDDSYKHGYRMLGLPVIGGQDKIVEFVEASGVKHIIIALPSATKAEISSIIDKCKLTKAKVQIMPSLNDLIHGKVTINQVRDVDVQDLLGRESVHVNLDDIAKYVNGKVVMVTGAGGSIGSELCRQLSELSPKQLLLLGHGENSIFNIELELKRMYPQLQYETIIADIQDAVTMESVFSRYHPQVVFHAAAHKHVPLMEKNPREAVKNNVFGTKTVAELSDRFGVERFVLISSDKAVNPTSIMGATKRLAELVVQCLNSQSQTLFSVVRFGNVLGSRGSVIPHFKEQIALGGPVTVTHPDMIRYFMTIPEAVQLVIQAGAFSTGGEVFILDMGKPVKILDLAEDLIRLSGLEPYSEIPITFTGIRPGEKLYEELLSQHEIMSETENERIFIGKSNVIRIADFFAQLKVLEQFKNADAEIIRDILQQIVPFSVQNEAARTSPPVVEAYHVKAN